MLKFGKYEVREQIGAGTFGDVFKGFDPTIKRNVAIKTCKTTGEEARLRFSREAEISGNLNHPSIVTLYDFGFEGETAYLVQELLNGEDLDDRIRRREQVALEVKLDWLEQIASGLAYAHAKGVIHRDIKPANVRVLTDDSVRILDFGIAKLIYEETVLTRAGVTLGTAGYASPEQVLGQPLDARSDVFSYGVLSYELLTFERPFPAQSAIDVMHRIVEGQVEPMDAVWPESPKPIRELVGRCLAKDPANRFQSFDELIGRLERLR